MLKNLMIHELNFMMDEACKNPYTPFIWPLFLRSWKDDFTFGIQ